MRVYHGPIEIAGQTFNSAKALRETGHEATAGVFEPHDFGYPYDELIYPNGKPSRWRGRIQRAKYLAKALRRFDVFNYWFARTILGGYDVRIASRLGNQIVMTFCGSEIRSVREAGKKSPFVDPNNWPKSSVDSEYLEWLNQFVDVAVFQYYELEPYVSRHFDRVAYVPRAIDCERITPHDTVSSGTIRIGHAPSDREFKGTKHIQNAVNSLQEDGHDVELTVVEGGHIEVIETLRKVDIVVDQLRVGTFGVLALEAMATETPVVCYLRDDLRDKYPDSLPIVNATPDNIRGVLQELIMSQNRRNNLGKAGREYVLDHHSLSHVGNKLVRVYGSI